MSFYVSDVATTARSMSASTAVNGTLLASNDPSSSSQDKPTLIVAGDDPVDTNARLSDQDLVQLVKRLRTPVGPPGKKKTAPVVVKDRLYHLRRYKECFVARDFVQTVMALGYCQTRREAVDIGRTLCHRGQMHHVVDDHDFRDGYYFFRWYADDLKVARTLSVRRGSKKKRRGT